MLKNVFFVVAAFLIASPAVVTAQDIFWSFDSGSAVSTTTASPGSSGSAYIFSDGLLGFDVIDINFTSSDSSVLLLMGGTVFNPTFDIIGGERFSATVLTIDPAGGDGSLFAFSAAANGVNTVIPPMFDPGFDPTVGPNGAFLIAEVNYDIVGSGTADLSFSLGPQGVAAVFPSPVIHDPLFGTATLTAVPEPSSLALLIFGLVGLGARRKRS